MWVHVIAVLGLASACGLWVVLQRAHGGERSGATGECGACAARKRGGTDQLSTKCQAKMTDNPAR